MTQIIEITDEKVLKLLAEKQEIANQNLKMVSELEAIEKETNKNAGLIARLDEKVRPKIFKLAPKLGEFEQISRIYSENGKWKMEIVDRLEQFKTNYKKTVNEK